jgi:hypothetical protein
MPGAFNREEPEVELPITESEGGDFEPSEGGAQQLHNRQGLLLNILQRMK